MAADDLIAQLRALYPKRDGAQGWSAVQRLLNAYTVESDSDALITGTKNYAIHCGRKAMVGTEYVMQARTFYGRDCHWREWSELDIRSPAQKAQDTAWEQLQARAEALGFTTIDRSRGLDVARRAIETEERNRAGQVLAATGLNLRVVR